VKQESEQGHGHDRIGRTAHQPPSPRTQSAIDLRDVAQRPQGPASLIDALPCCLALDTEGDEVAHDRRSAFPVVQQDRAEPTPDMGVERAQRELLTG
jgi:hypothetical protein